METPNTIPTDLLALEEEFATITGDSRVAVLFAAGRWLEGPAYSPQGHYLLFSDIPNDRVLRFDEVSGRVDVVSDPAGFANGRTLDLEGRFVTCEHGARRVVRVEHDGTTRVLAASHGSRRLNSPNDVVVAADASVWFTDPSYGIRSDYEGYRSEEEQASRNLYRWCEGDAEPQAVAIDFDQPNGLAFSPDEATLYVVDSERGHIRAFDHDRGRLGSDRVLVDSDAGFDGIRVDSEGRIWAATHQGVSCFASDGRELGRLQLPEVASNVCFGGLRRNVLYVTATTSLYSIRLSVSGAVRPGPQ